MVAVDLSSFMHHDIERVGREPDTVAGNIYTWLLGDQEVVVVVGNEMTDIDVHLPVNGPPVDPEDSYYHQYGLADYEDWNGASMGADRSWWTYNDLIENVGCQIAAALNIA
jgi:hypothetical protein